MQPIRLNDYQKEAAKTDVSRGHDSASFLLLGLFGETGSVLSEVKKRERDQARPALYRERLPEEIGDTLWYISTVADRNSIGLGEIAAQVLLRRKQPITRQADDLTFSDLQPLPLTQVLGPSLFLEWRLVEVAEAAGALIAAHRRFLKDKARNRPSLLKAFGDLLYEVVNVCNRAGVSLQEAAFYNLSKTLDRWPLTRVPPPLLDEGYPQYERLPQSILVDIKEVQTPNDQYFVYQTCNGIHIGDRLTDNIADPDDYRFHDVFHYAYVAVLGWSPVTRALFKTKRKSNKTVDEAQDGARAILVEEGLSAIIFNEAKKSAFFEHVARGRLSFDLLKTIKNFVEGYEVDRTPFWAWEEAILQGYEAFRYLRKHRCGTIAINGRELTIGELRV